MSFTAAHSLFCGSNARFNRDCRLLQNSSKKYAIYHSSFRKDAIEEGASGREERGQLKGRRSP